MNEAPVIRRILKRLRPSPSSQGTPALAVRPVRPVVRPVPPQAPAIPGPDAPRELLLYRDDSCGFCRRVDRVVQGLGLDVPSIDTRVDAEARKAHRNRTGRNTVPCLYIDDVPLFESADIIDWLEAYAQAVSLD